MNTKHHASFINLEADLLGSYIISLKLKRKYVVEKKTRKDLESDFF